MDFNKYLPKCLIVKNVLNLNQSTIARFFIIRKENLNPKYFTHNRIVSWHPFIIKDGNNFYYFKGIKETDFLLAGFCLNNENFEQDFNNKILENYFEKNSFEI